MDTFINSESLGRYRHGVGFRIGYGSYETDGMCALMDASVEPDDGRPEDDYVLSDQIGYLFRLANQRHSAIFMEKTILDLTPTQFSALVRLAELGECSQNQLGRATAMDVATIKGVVGRLQTKGLIELSADPHDKRRLIVSLAPGHRDLIPKLSEIGAEISRETLRPLTAAEQKTLVRLLKKLT